MAEQAATPVVPALSSMESRPTVSAYEPCAKSFTDGARGFFREGAVLPTSLCLTKAAMGAGMLGMSLRAAQAGMLCTLVGLFLGGCLTVVSDRMIAEAAVATRRWSFEGICEELFHPAMSLFTGFVNTVNCLGSAASYLIIAGQVFIFITNAEEWRTVFVILVGVLVCGPLALAPRVSFLRYLAAASVGAIIILTLVIAALAGDEGLDDSITEDTFWSGKGGATVVVYMNAINIIVWAYFNQFNVPQLTGELTPKPDVGRMTIVACIATAISSMLYTSVAVVGVLAFGVYDQKDSLVVDLFPYRHRPEVIVANLAVMFSVIICFQFHIYPIRQFLAYLAQKVRARATDAGRHGDRMLWGLSLTRWLDMASGVAAVLVAIVISVAITQVTTLLTFLGAFAGSWISYVVPPLFVLQIRKGVEGFSWWNFEVIECAALFLLGVFLFVFGTYAAVVG